MSLHIYFEHLLSQTQLSVDDEQTQKLLEFVTLLNKWNQAYNLTSVRDPQQMLSKHIFDSLVVSSHLQGSSFIDVGTGPGLPGVPLAILNPDKAFVLLDSLGKRIRFLRQVMYHLQLKNITLVQCRVEQYQHEYAFDGVLSRAFASIKDMLLHCRHLVNVKAGLFYALKGTYPQGELQDIPPEFEMQDIVPLQVPGLDAQRHLVIFQKIS